jgi:hypothetical protein
MSTVLWAAAIGAAAAQTGIPKSTQLNPGTVRSGGGKFVVLGCVSQEGQAASPTFVITDSRATPPVRYRLDGDGDLLHFHVGHTVEIGGPITPAPQAASGTAAVPALKIQSLTYISRSCVKAK